jgi:PAS domain S-box-containing protein
MSAVWLYLNKMAMARKSPTESYAEEQLRIYQQIFEFSNDPIALIDPQGRYIAQNAAHRSMLGYSDAEIRNQTPAMHLGEEMFSQISAQLARAGQFRGTVRSRLKSGNETYFDLSAFSIRNNNGDVIAHVGIKRDMTDRTRAERANARLGAIIESSDDAIIGKTLEGIVTSWNAAAQRVFGYTADEVVGQPITILIPSDRMAEEKEIITRLRKGERIDHFETIRQRKDRQYIHVSLTISPIKDAEGNIIGVSKIARDITARKQADEALKKAHDELEQRVKERTAELEQQARELSRSNAELERFAYVASHDLKEPLRMVISYTQLLARRYKGKLDADADEFIKYAVDGATRMEDLIRDLLVFSRVGAHRGDIHPVDMNHVLSRALANLRASIEESGAVISHDALPTVIGDETELIQLLQNLIGNAIKFRGEARPEVHLSAARCSSTLPSSPRQGAGGGEYWMFAVRDSGIGIPPQYSDRIFLLFQRLHNRAEYPGTGIGLAICKKIVENYGGRIWVESQLGQGSTFYFTLPGAGSHSHESSFVNNR